MLTVKHIDTDGTETILEAERVEKVDLGYDVLGNGIYVDREPAPAVQGLLGQIEPTPRAFKHVIPFAYARSALDTNPVVYVMNRFGATVATYHL